MCNTEHPQLNIVAYSNAQLLSEFNYIESKVIDVITCFLFTERYYVQLL